MDSSRPSRRSISLSPSRRQHDAIQRQVYPDLQSPILFKFPWAPKKDHKAKPRREETGASPLSTPNSLDLSVHSGQQTDASNSSESVPKGNSSSKKKTTRLRAAREKRDSELQSADQTEPGNTLTQPVKDRIQQFKQAIRRTRRNSIRRRKSISVNQCSESAITKLALERTESYKCGIIHSLTLPNVRKNR